MHERREKKMGTAKSARVPSARVARGERVAERLCDGGVEDAKHSGSKREMGHNRASMELRGSERGQMRRVD